METKSAFDSTAKKSSILFSDFQNLQRIWTHPRVLRYNSDKYELNQQKKVCFIFYNNFFFLFN